jgi:hypothetical protein
MKIFISWSGETSRQIAQHLRDWLPQVIQAAQPWMSKEIPAGARWREEIAGQLQDARAGIICLTPDNLRAEWLHFEAGAISKSVANAFVCPYLFGVKPSDIIEPLAMFQAKSADEDGTRELIETINAAMDQPLKSEILRRSLERCWPELKEQLARVQAPKPIKPARSEMEILEELVGLVRYSAFAENNRAIAASSGNVVVTPGTAHLKIDKMRAGPYTNPDPAGIKPKQ